MKNEIQILSAKTIRRLEIQGFTGYSDIQLSEHRPGIRFAYQLCGTLVLLGLILQSIPVLSFLLLTTLIATFHPRHPFDYIYNIGFRHLTDKPKTPPRKIQGNIACALAFVMLAMVIYLFHFKLFLGGYIVGGILLASALLVSTTDTCIPSIVYNYFRRNKSNSKNYDYI